VRERERERKRERERERERVRERRRRVGAREFIQGLRCVKHTELPTLIGIS
jgi:hypothetical protein